MNRKWITFGVVLLYVCIWINTSQAHELSQVVISPTPLRITISTSTPLPTAGAAPTAIPPTFTPTNEGPPQLEVKPEASEVNVRAEADINADILGVIRPGERFPVTGKYYRWYRIRFDPSPSGAAYVFEDLVNIFGDETSIPDLTQSLLPTQDNSIIEATETMFALQQTPGFELTITANARVIEAPADQDIQAEETDEAGNLVILPTFTYPPNVVAQAPTPVPPDAVVSPTLDPTRLTLDTADGIAPIVPIVLLASLGLIGLLLNAIMRR